MRVNVICRNYNDDRVLPRFARYLRDRHGWSLTAQPEGAADLVYLSGYFETRVCRDWPECPVAAYMTHREEGRGSESKARLYDEMAARLNLRIATARMYADALGSYGPTVQIAPPVERERFTVPKRHGGKPVAGFSGYTYGNGRKGEDVAKMVIASEPGRRVDWIASGRGWPVKTRRYSWRDMPSFYQALDVLIIPSRVEGVPMPPLEALSCGVSVVVPRNVGLLDELQDTPGIHRYERGDWDDLLRAFDEALRMRGDVDREALRAVTEPYTVAGWCDAHRLTFEQLLDNEPGKAKPAKAVEVAEPVQCGTESRRGIYVVAFGRPARACATRLMQSIKTHLPEIPICLCAAETLGLEDVLVVQPDSDIGGRRAKLRAYELAPAEWESVLYLDADTEVVGDIRFYFELIEDGWEFVICKDPHLMDSMHNFRRPNSGEEMRITEREISTLHTLQYNGGVWAFRRNDRVRRFFGRWQAEWERYAQRDQGALVRAMYTEPLRVYLLGNDWNTFEKYSKGIQTAGLMHYPGDARRWNGLIPGRIDSPEAWQAVKVFERRH